MGVQDFMKGDMKMSKKQEKCTIYHQGCPRQADPTHRIFKVQCVIIQAILSRKTMKNLQLPMKKYYKIFHVYKAFDHKK